MRRTLITSYPIGLLNTNLEGTKAIEGKKKYKDTPVPTVNQVLEKLNKEKRISTGEEGQEPGTADKDQHAAPAGPVLGSALSQDLLELSLQQMTVPNPPYVATSMYISKCHSCPAPIQSLKRKLKVPNDLFKLKAIRPYRYQATPVA